jgi:hypothetical protein|uniref:Uncharacterized protein n=1 Tax=viral metagenome TaxID=1070528 RepID=A0A6C0IUJ2_9ZZZZ
MSDIIDTVEFVTKNVGDINKCEEDIKLIKKCCREMFLRPRDSVLPIDIDDALYVDALTDTILPLAIWKTAIRVHIRTDMEAKKRYDDLLQEIEDTIRDAYSRMGR